MSVIRLARVVGDAEWHVFPGATICGAAQALMEHEQPEKDEVSVEVADNETPSTIYELTLVRKVGWDVRGARGGE